eukprot:867704-Amphidinium_carterae.1
MLTEGRQDVEIGALGDFPLDDAEEDHDKAARVAKPVAEETHDFCRPMRIQYWNPWEDEPVNEAAYVDPQDEWDGGSGALLVSINALNALKNRSALQYRYHEETLLSVERCRRDYLREQQYLLDELARLEHDADFQTAQEIRRQVDTASIAREIAATNPVRVLGARARKIFHPDPTSHIMALCKKAHKALLKLSVCILHGHQAASER